MLNSLYESRLQGIMVFVFQATTTIIFLAGVPHAYGELDITLYIPLVLEGRPAHLSSLGCIISLLRPYVSRTFANTYSLVVQLP